MTVYLKPVYTVFYTATYYACFEKVYTIAEDNDASCNKIPLDDEKAHAIFTDALLTGRDCYLVETKPPFEYNIVKEVTKISFVDIKADENGIYTVQIANRIGILLPTAGGVGTVILCITGALMIGAAVFFVVSKEKFEVKESK